MLGKAELERGHSKSPLIHNPFSTRDQQQANRRRDPQRFGNGYDIEPDVIEIDFNSRSIEVDEANPERLTCVGMACSGLPINRRSEESPFEGKKRVVIRCDDRPAGEEVDAISGEARKIEFVEWWIGIECHVADFDL